MEIEVLEKFVEKIKREINIHKFLKEDVIIKLISSFQQDYKKISYSKKIKNPLEMVLNFYKYYNQQYYIMIIEALKCKKIIIDSNIESSFTDTNRNIAFLKPLGNDGDIFMLVHEMAHFIDRNSKPFIIPNEYNFLCEVYSFYMEKQFECWLSKQGYEELIRTRRNNRIYFEAKMMRAIKYEMNCETVYRKFGTIDLNSLDKDMVKQIMNYHYDVDTSLINYLLRYPIANILSDYLIQKSSIKSDYDICEACLNTNLYETLDEAICFKIN